MTEIFRQPKSPKELLNRLLKKLEQEIENKTAITIENSENKITGLCYLKPIAGYNIYELKIISTSSSDLLANKNKISKWLQRYNRPLVVEQREGDEEYSNLIGYLRLVADKIGEKNLRFKGMTGNLSAFRKIQQYVEDGQIREFKEFKEYEGLTDGEILIRTISHESSKNLIYERIFLPKIEEIKEKLIGYQDLELGIKITRSGMKNENRFAIEITEAGSLDHPQRKKLENLLRLYYNQLPKSRFRRKFESLDYNPDPDHEKPKPINDNYYLYTVKLADLFNILEDKETSVESKLERKTYSRYNNNEIPN